MNCKKCGLPMKAGTKVCSVCGTPVEENIEIFNQENISSINPEPVSNFIEDTENQTSFAKLNVELSPAAEDIVSPITEQAPLSQETPIINNTEINKNEIKTSEAENNKKIDKKTSKLAFLFSLLIVVFMVGYFGYQVYEIKKVGGNKPNQKLLSSLMGDPTCNKVSLEKFLANYNLTEDNIEFNGVNEFQGYKTHNVFLVYEGYIFDDELYEILIKDDKVYCSNQYDETSKLLTLEELKEKYDNLSEKELKGKFAYGIYNTFKMYNMMSSTSNITSYLKRCNLTQTEKAEQIRQVNDDYDEFIKENKSHYKIKYTKEEILSAINAA